MMFGPALEGFVLGGGLIIAIGAQNAFILKQGLLQQHVFALCLVASLADAMLILLGVAGIGTLVQSNLNLLFYVAIGGGIFLAIYALLAVWRVLNPVPMKAADGSAVGLGSALIILVVLTLLNPHVYLDTVVLIGGISGQYIGAERVAFGVGAMVASFTWFFSLGYGARWLVPFFENPTAWRILDGIIAVVMAFLSYSLLSSAFP